MIMYGLINAVKSDNRDNADLIDLFYDGEPGPDRPVVSPGEIDLVLVPGLAFDRRGYRLGQGGGYYDRYLPQTKAVTVALCRSCFLLDAVPREEHDAPVDLVLTEEETFGPAAF